MEATQLYSINLIHSLETSKPKLVLQITVELCLHRKAADARAELEVWLKTYREGWR